VDEGLTIVRAVRARHAGTNRNPWNEAECGNHYARSLASWALLLALTGVHYDGTRRSLAFSPAEPGDQRFFFSTGSGWGRAVVTADAIELSVDFGTVTLDSLTVHGHPALFDGAQFTGHVIEAGRSSRFSLSND
jgi:non-lysosomal glucosylceramidase